MVCEGGNDVPGDDNVDEVACAHDKAQVCAISDPAKREVPPPRVSLPFRHPG